MRTYAKRPARRAVLVLAAVAGLILAPATTAQAAVRVRATGSQTFRPARLRIDAGTRVVWKAVSGRHTVTAYRGDWAKDVTISAGETTSFRFDDPGRYRYRCTFHSTLVDGVCSGMCGKVRVR
jgi:plastocyanin